MNNNTNMNSSTLKKIVVTDKDFTFIKKKNTICACYKMIAYN